MGVVMRKVAIIIIIAILYVITARLSQFLGAPGELVSPVWPPAGIALAAVLIFGNMTLIAIFLGCFISNFHMFAGAGITVASILYAAVPGMGGAIQAYVGKLALIKFSGTYDIFKNTRSVLTFILISAFGACLINATLGASILMLTGHIPVTSISYAWLTWWIADSVGVITVTSTIIAWNQKSEKKVSFLQIAKLTITWVLILIVGYLTLHSEVQLAYLLIPFAIWSAFQFEIRFSILTGLLISSVCLYGSIYGYDVIRASYETTSILWIQVFISIIYLTILLIHAILSDRQKAYDNLQLLNVILEKRVLERTKDLSETNQQLNIQKDKAVGAFEALMQSHARLMQSEKMAALGVLTAGVAHEIKNPLNAMSANIEAIENNMDLIVQSTDQTHIDENVKNEVNRINENTKSLLAATDEGIKRTVDIIADLCAYARSDEQEMIMTDLHRNIDSTLNLLSSEITGNISIVKEYGEIPSLLCHPGKLNQVFMNILINAIHALQGRRDGKIIIKTESKDSSIVLSIKDNGPGMKQEIVAKVFTPFFTTKQSSLGTGLGLFISYNIIREHNGTISVVSEPEKGTEFIITLPIERDVNR